jgi:hypothetical protein
MYTPDDPPVPGARVIKAASSRFAAMQMDIGNIVSMLLPPLPVLWFGLSILVYAMHRHHPDPKVGEYTRWAGYRFYAVMGLIIPVGTFFPGDAKVAWLVAWILGILVIVPWSAWSILRARRDHWEDIVLPSAEVGEGEEPEHA